MGRDQDQDHDIEKIFKDFDKGSKLPEPVMSNTAPKRFKIQRQEHQRVIKDEEDSQENYYNPGND